MTTAISTYAKPDTVLLLDMVATDPWIDLSQHRTNLADNTTYVSEANSARTALDAPREIAIVVTVESGEEGILAQLGDAGGYSWRVRISGDVVEVAEHAKAQLRVVHGDDDQLVPVASAARTAALVPHATVTIYPGAPHGLCSTHKAKRWDRFVSWARPSFMGRSACRASIRRCWTRPRCCTRMPVSSIYEITEPIPVTPLSAFD